MRPLVVLSMTACAAGNAPIEKPRAMPTPIDHFGTDVADAFGGYNLLYYAAAVGATGALAFSGADHRIHVATSQTDEHRPWLKTASIAGYVLPTLTPTALWSAGLALRDRELAGAGAAAIQAVAVAMATTGVLKLGTGRPRSAVDESIDDSDRPRTFEPFQRISNWPSGHTTGMFSLTAALTAYAPEKRWIPAIGYPLSLAIGVGMIDLNGHWTSDVVAGALIGHAIGYSVGRNYRKRVRNKQTRELVVAPMPGGLGLCGRW